MRMHLTIRFDYGQIIPWVRNIDGALVAVAGPDALVLRTPVETHGEGHSTVAEFTVRRGQRVPFSLAWYPSHLGHTAAPERDPVLAHDGVVVA